MYLPTEWGTINFVSVICERCDIQDLKAQYYIIGYQWIFINLLKSTAFSLQTSEKNLKHPLKYWWFQINQFTFKAFRFHKTLQQHPLTLENSYFHSLPKPCFGFNSLPSLVKWYLCWIQSAHISPHFCAKIRRKKTQMCPQLCFNVNEMHKSWSW